MTATTDTDQVDQADQADTLPPGFDRAAARLFAPLRVGPFTLRTRVVHAALGQARSISGSESRLAPIYFEQRTVPGSLVVSQATAVAATARPWPYAAVLDSAADVDALARAVAAVHVRGGVWFQQLFHAGRSSSPALVRRAHEAAGVWEEPADGWRPVSASAVAEPGFNTHSGEAFGEPHALTVGEIHAIVGQFKTAAQKALRAGADGIEILAANGYLLDQFLHDNINRRDDAYGGSIENRARFVLEVVDAVAAVAGPQRVGVRISPFSDLHDTDGAQPLAQLLYVAQQLAVRGVAYVHVRGPRAPGRRSIADNLARLQAKGIAAADLSLAPFRAVLRATRPIDGTHQPAVLLASGGYTSVTALLDVEAGRADAVAFGREFVANPDLPARLRHGYPLTDYDPDTLYAHGPTGYITYKRWGEGDANGETNGETNRETNGHANGNVPTPPRKRVAIVGAGVSGLLSAYAFRRLGGFDVQVLEQKDKAGGSWAYDAVSKSQPQFVTPDLDVINAPLPRPPGPLPQTRPRSTQNRFASSPLYPHLQANVPYTVMGGGSSIHLRAEPGQALFLRGAQVSAALAEAAAPLADVIRYRTTLERVDVLPGTTGPGGTPNDDRLRLLLRAENADGTDTWTEEEVDHLVVASGHNAVPVVPTIPGIGSWPGGLQHSTTWRRGEELRDKRVLLVGTSESGTDIALQSLPFVRQPLYVSQRTVNPRYPDLLKRDGVRVVTTIDHFDGDAIHLTDGTVLTGIDHVLFATGYAYTYPFFPPEVRPPAVAGLRVPGLYEHVFDRHNPQTIAFVGLIQGELTWLAWEKTAFVLALLWSGRIALPPPAEQKAWEDRRLAATSDRTFHVMLEGPYARVLYYERLNELARDYLEDPRSRDDGLLRSFPFDWVLALQAAIPAKEAFYRKGVYAAAAVSEAGGEEQ